MSICMGFPHAPSSLRFTIDLDAAKPTSRFACLLSLLFVVWLGNTYFYMFRIETLLLRNPRPSLCAAVEHARPKLLPPSAARVTNGGRQNQPSLRQALSFFLCFIASSFHLFTFLVGVTCPLEVQNPSLKVARSEHNRLCWNKRRRFCHLSRRYDCAHANSC
jgi:hypothetical protein